MNRSQSFIIITLCVLAASVAAAPPCALAAEPMGLSGGHDLDDLWSRAQSQFDLASEDAVVLLESRQVSILSNGDLRTRVHRVVWVGASAPMRGYADLRIPYNSATSVFKVNSLRTWRDDRWWPEAGVSKTAVVETLPFAVARADDYTTMRETMLLHDGVEIPCIMETDYEIVERGAAAYGSDGLWIFAQDDPAVRVELKLDVSQGESVTFHSGNGAPGPEVTAGDGRDTYLWAMENIGRRGTPHIDDPAVSEPYAVWSTWRDWGTLGGMITTSFNEAAVLNTAMADTLRARLEHEPTPASRVRAIAELVNEFVRDIHYDSRFWRFSPRPASRTWDTAYGHRLDRAVLAVALFRGAGFEADLVFRSAGIGGMDVDVPGLSRFEDVVVRIKTDSRIGYYNPSRGAIATGSHEFRGRTLWMPGSQPPHFNDPKDMSHFELALTVQPGDEGGWTGHGFVSTDGVFCPYDDMVGFGDEALEYIGRVVSSVIDGAGADGFNPETFGTTRVTGGFALHVKKVDPDDLGRTAITIHAPAGGIASRLPSDVHLYDEKRTSPVVLSDPMTQRVKLRVKTGGREVAYIPRERELENVTGRFTLRAKEKDGWITIERELTLNAGVIPPAGWPELRALLLEDAGTEGSATYLK